MFLSVEPLLFAFPSLASSVKLANKHVVQRCCIVVFHLTSAAWTLLSSVCLMYVLYSNYTEELMMGIKRRIKI